MKKNIYLVLFFWIAISYMGYSQTNDLSDVIQWKNLIKETDENGTVTEYLYFDGAFTDIATYLPLYTRSFPIKSAKSEISAEFTSSSFEPCSNDEMKYLLNIQFSESSVIIITSVAVIRKVPAGVVSFIPIRKNAETGMYEKLVSFSVRVSEKEIPETKTTLARNYAENSVLSSGEWYKIKTDTSGIYKISYSDLQNYGLNPAAINPSNIRIYGNADGMLPEKNDLFRYDDLQENAIWVSGEADGVFDEEDFILFYGKSPHTWQNILGFFTYDVNYYENYNYYYLTVSTEAGKRVETEPSSTLNPTHVLTEYDDYKVIEDEKTNLILSGKEWYGDAFGEINIRDYHFNFPHLKAGEDIVVKTEIANRTFINESMAVRINDDYYDTVILTSVNPGSTKYAQKKKKTMTLPASGLEINITLEYLPSSSSSIAWLDYIMVNAVSNLNFYDGQLSFRELSTVQDGAITRFVIADANPDIIVWEITNPIIPKIIGSEYSNNELSFTLRTDSLREFIAFDGSKFNVPEFVEAMQNQNLHGQGPFDMVIVTHPLFLEEASQLATIHEIKDGLQIKITTPDEIYNEFSSGKQDPSAIRDYIKMLYDKHEGQEPRFLTLFGDGSVDPKDRFENNSNFIPAFQNQESWQAATSYVIDDYYGYLDDGEGEDAFGELDIGIGRLPVQTREEAQIIIDKSERYIATGEPSFGTWRSKICLIADDEDGNLHLEQADSLANGYIPKDYNLEKIYLDAYTQVNTPAGFRYPEVTLDLNNAVNDGALIVNYVGHGGKAGWAAERILQLYDILSWKNKDRLSVFITASCEFSRFDIPEPQTGGELVLLNPEGGGIALFTTTRLAYSQANFSCNQLVYTAAFNSIEGERPYLGDIIQRSKPPGQSNTRNFVLLGDPALKLAYPDYEVKTLKITKKLTEELADTLQALDAITVTGEIVGTDGNKVESFNGFLNVSVFDKKTRYNTLGNDSHSFPIEFYCQDKIIWQGKVSVTGGSFNFSFMVPKDIAYNYDSGKISFYAWNDEADASGYYDEFVIGGVNGNAETDTQGPEIDIYLNDLAFISGDQTNESPVMYAFLNDLSGINISAAGIGHGITAVLDDDYSNIINLNEYYIQDMDSYQRGKITFPFFNLPDGNHKLTLKAWDNYNNSGEKTIEFVISTQAELALSQVKNYPNPFKDFTTFSFDHTRLGDELDIVLEIFDLSGRMILTYQNSLTAELTSTPFLIWGGDDLKGNKLKSGIYLYTVKVTDENGDTSVQRQKLMLIGE